MRALYQAEGCGYSASVREALTALGVSCVVHNRRSASGAVGNRETYDELLDHGGNDQIPFLVAHNRGVTTYESDEVVAYLREHYS